MKKEFKDNLIKRIKTEKGITLIALVITIIVLLILAGVTIATLTGDNGLLQKATKAKEENEESKELEMIKLAAMTASVNGKGQINSEEELINQLNNNGINVQGNQLEETDEMWVYNKSSDIIYYVYKNGTVLKEDLSNGKVPTGYTRVKYLCDNGAQYIKTGYVHDSNAIFELTTPWSSLMQGTVSTVRYYFGSKTSDGKANILMTCSGGPRVTTYMMGNREWYYNFYNMFSSDGNTNATVKCGNKVGLFINNDKKIDAHNYSSFDSAEIYLFAVNNNNEIMYSTVSKSIIINFKIYDENENLKLDFIPCLDRNHRPCMYDKVSHKSFYNQGSGEFGYELEDGTYMEPQ